MSYNLLDLRSRVRTKIKDTSYSASTIDSFINDAIFEIAGLFPWIYLQKIATGALTTDVHTLAQQSDWQRTTKLILLNPTTPTSNRDITKYFKTWETFFNLWPAPDLLNSAQPIYWTEYGTTIYFNCPADVAYLFRQFYQRTPTDLAADSDVPDFPVSFREAIVLGATYRCEQERENDDIAALRQNEFNDKIGDLIMRFANDSAITPDTVLPMNNEDDY